MKEYEQRMNSFKQVIEDGLRTRMPIAENMVQSRLIDAMGYGVLDGGKRLRGILAMEFNRLSKGSHSAGVAVACAVEMVHAYSLIHDDLPCMDNDDLRRGKPSCHKQYGEATALLAGDALLTSAFELVARAPMTAEQRAKSVLILADMAGIHGMIGGQMMDMQAEQERVTPDYLAMMETKKCACLIQAACQLGCATGSDDVALAGVAAEYAMGLGLAFQITDDILDVTGDTQILGKKVGSDADNHKTTYVTLFGLRGAREAAMEQLQRARTAANLLYDNGFLLWILESVIKRTK